MLSDAQKIVVLSWCFLLAAGCSGDHRAPSTSAAAGAGGAYSYIGVHG